MRNSLENVKLIDNRRVGNTTRIIDNAIQILFEDGKVELLDHYTYGSKQFPKNLESISYTIGKRVMAEHQIKILIELKDQKVIIKLP